MKNLITTIGSIIILMVFLLQFTTNQVTYNKLHLIDKSVNAFKEIAKQEGSVSDENSNQLARQISNVTNCTEEEIAVDGTKEPVLRGELIHYRIQVPINNVIAAAGFWGITQENNCSPYIIDSYTTSEYLGNM